MKNYMEKWKEEHVAIENALATAVELDICSKEGQKKMGEVKSLIVKHLQSEDDSLYPLLRRAAKEDVFLQKMIDLFAMDMEEISGKIGKFFEEYEKNPEDDIFDSKLGRIIDILKTRITREESIFMKEYDTIMDNIKYNKKVV